MTRLFQEAKEASAAWNLAKTALQTSVFWAVLLFLVPGLLVCIEAMLGVPSFAPQRGGGVAVFVVASALGLWSGATMAVVGQGTPLPLDTARKLVIRGPYAWVRNPMAVAGLTQGAGVGLVLGSWGVLLYVLAGGLLWHTLVRPVEEADLAARFGASFEQYRRAVRCWWPRWRR
ncbi:MAG: isoprenylcysteine carboxylmethyltransferase family protein [Bacteroidota bacterium]